MKKSGSFKYEIVSRETLKEKINTNLYSFYCEHENMFGIKIKNESSYLCISSDSMELRETDTVLEIRNERYIITIFKDTEMILIHTF